MEAFEWVLDGACEEGTGGLAGVVLGWGIAVAGEVAE